jgi:hypothetical protein
LERAGERDRKSRTTKTHLALDSTGFIIALSGGSHATTNTNSSIASHNTTSLSKTLLALLLANLDLLLLTAATELIGAELVLGLELRPTMLGNIAFRHVVCCRKEKARLWVSVLKEVMGMGARAMGGG